MGDRNDHRGLRQFALINILLLLLSFLLLALLTGCGSDSPTGNDETEIFSQELEDYANKVVVATYEDMRDAGADLQEAAEAFAASPTDQSKLDAVCAAWRAMRAPWEKSEAFLFGPAEFLSLDPSLDSWPVDRQQLQDVLDSDVELTAERVADGLSASLRGFHTVEFLIFSNGQPKQVANVTARERDYLVAASTVLAEDAARLADAWKNEFAEEFANAGESSSRYNSQYDAVIEILEGMSGICDEVANGKIADPFDEQNPGLVESQFSWNSIDDFANNIRSVRNAYRGEYDESNHGVGLDVYVASKDSALDARLKGEIDAAIAAIENIPAPFRNNLTATAEITAAQEAVLTVFNTIEEDIKPLFVN